MFNDEIVMILSPQTFSEFDMTSAGDPAGAGGTLFVTVTFSVSPGLTCSVGDCLPSGVIKQNRVRPASSTAVR